ncbi:MAG: TIGR03960 family B12-binding radical SAM protein [Desulfovibrionaceae bacterium]|nr:TIGR03960 family B12-binding radical SAM protein [Desulfovibrionaceae bacterium]
MREILALLPRPSRYLGNEEGAVRGDPAAAELHCALAFPDLYEVAMSYLGQKILYGQLNAMPGVLAERVFAPCRDAAAILRERKVPLATLESDTDLARTHLIGFSITHELAFTNVLYMLDLAGIPLRAAERGDDLSAWPLIVAGGGCTLCAEPLAPFMDLMVLGESEAVLPGLIALIRRARSGGWSKRALLAEARHVPGVYVPSLFREKPDGSLEPVYPDYAVVRRRVAASLRGAFYPVEQVTPFGAVHNRLSLEIARGCTRGCRFCQAGMTLRPSRERPISDVSALLEDCLTRTGYDDVSFLSLSCGDFSGLRTLFLDAADRCAREQISLSLPSLRVGSVDGDIMARMAGIRRTGATLAPEAGSQRLRDVINKGVSEEGLLLHVRHLAGHGWQQVKLYFMIGLPTETREDLDALVELALKVRDCCRFRDEAGKWRGPRLNVTVAVSPFVPKTHTPFQWEAQISLADMEERIRYLRDAVRPHKNVALRWHEPAMSHLEGILSRGDRRLAGVVETAYRKGAVFSSWVEGFDFTPWQQALDEHGMTAGQWIGPRDPDGPLPWDHLWAGTSRRFLLTERRRAFAGSVTADCRYAPCRQCGVCDTKAGPSLLRMRDSDPPLRTTLNFPRRDQRDHSPVPPLTPYEPGKKAAPPAIDPKLTARAVRYRIWHRKEGLAAWLSQLELQSLLERAMRRAGLPLAFSQGFHPLPLLSFGRALPVGMASRSEWCIVTLRAPLRAEEVLERLDSRMPDGMTLIRAELLPLTGKVISPAAELFQLSYADFSALRAAWQTFADAERWDFEREARQGGVRVQNLRPLLRDFQFRDGDLVFTADWSRDYLSPLTLTRAILPDLDPLRLELVKLAQFFDAP